MKQIIVDATPEEIRIATLENDELVGMEIERPSHSHLVGNIYKGRVQNVLPGMQAAFVDIDKEKNAFLFVGDGSLVHGEIRSEEERLARQRAMPWLNGQPNQRISVGQYLPVQITKDKTDLKGPRATMHISVPGRNLVLMPVSSGYIGMSHRITDEKEKKRLRSIVREFCPQGMGMIVRTAAVGQAKETLKQDIEYLTGLWESILAKFKQKNSGLLYRDADLIIRTIRDDLDDKVADFVINDKIIYQRAKDLASSFSASLGEKIKYYDGRINIFSHYHVDEELEKLKSRTVELKSGGFLVIDKTEAMTVIDVNTGKYVGDTNLGETVFKMNLEAADEIMKQLRLRDIGGIIIIDFIDMDKNFQKEELIKRLAEQAKKDKTKINVVDITALGLVEITRKKSRQNMETIIFNNCPVCNGTGLVESAETIFTRICGELRRSEKKKHNSSSYEIQLSPEVEFDFRVNNSFGDLQKELGISIRLVGRKDILPGSFSLLQI